MPTNVLVLNKSWVVTGAGDPEGLHPAPVGSVYLREEGEVGTSFYIKEAGAGTTGWKAVGASAPQGDVVGPAVSVNDALVLFSGTTGKLLKDSMMTVATLCQKTINNNFTVGQTITGSLQATDLGTTPLNANSLISGTVPDARLSANVQMKPVAQSDVANLVSDLAAKGNVSFVNSFEGDDYSEPGNLVIFDGVDGKTITESWYPLTQLYDLANKTAPNVFTAGQEMPTLRLRNTASLPDQQAWHFAVDYYGALHVKPITNAGGFRTGTLKVAGDLDLHNEPQLGTGNLTVAGTGTFMGTVTAAGLGTTPLNANNLTTGTVPDARLASNVARCALPNIFTAHQEISTAEACLYIRDTSWDPNARLWQIAASYGSLHFTARTDADAYQAEVFACNRDGTMSFYGPPSFYTDVKFLNAVAVGGVVQVGSTLLPNVSWPAMRTGTPAPKMDFVTGTQSAFIPIECQYVIANGPGSNLLDLTVQGNTVLQSNVTMTGLLPIFSMVQPLRPVDTRRWEMQSTSGGALAFYPVSDLGALQASPLMLDRAGNAYTDGLIVAGQIFERNRSVALGEWIDVPFVASNFYGVGGLVWTVTAGHVSSNRYTLIGKTLIWAVKVTGSSTSGTAYPYVYLMMPGGFSCANAFRGGTVATEAWDGVGPCGIVRVKPTAGQAIECYKESGNFNPGGFHLGFTVMVEIN